MANYDVELNIPGKEKCFDFLCLAPYARTTRHDEAFLAKGKKRPRSLRSLRLASLQTHVAAPGSIKSKRITSKTALEGFVSICACTEPVQTGIGAVCVEYGRPKWPITMLN